MNKVIMIGRLTKDPEVRYTNGGSSVANFNIAVDRRFKQDGGATADFFRCAAFGKNAEFAEKYLTKGIKIALTGRLETGSYKNKEGVTIPTITIMCEELEFAESKKNSDGNSNNDARQQKPSSNAGDEDFMDIPEDLENELPFI